MAKTKVTPRKHTNETCTLWEIRFKQKKTKPAIAKILLARWCRFLFFLLKKISVVLCKYFALLHIKYTLKIHSNNLLCRLV